MNKSLRSAIKFVLAGVILLTLTSLAFSAGFGSAYLLTRADFLPIASRSAPTSTPVPSPQPQIEEVVPTSVPTLTPTPIPIPKPENEDQETFQLFWEAWDLVQRHFYGEVPDMQEVTYAAIRGMLNALGDEYTSFMEPEIASIIAEDATGEFEGIGAYVNMGEDGKLEIVEPFQGGPAIEAGLRAGDRILEVDGVSIVGVTIYEALALIRGPADTEVTLLVEREEVSEPFEVTVTRARIEIPIVEVEMRDDGVGYVQLREFSAKATEITEGALEELLAQEPQGIVFDLRQNPGGWLEQAVKVSDLFLDDGLIVLERWSSGKEFSFEAHPGDIGENVPLVVLVDEGSASASEIVAGALQDQERAVLIGEPTLGKGSVQQPFTLSDGSELRVTVALWFTPDDRAIHEQGLTPDVEVVWPEVTPEGEETEPQVPPPGETEADPQLERAVEYLLTGK
jgi:carboxyl-terminal processing protease